MNETAFQTKSQSQTNPLLASSVLQRKCACGNHTVAGGECAECAKSKNGLQPKLAIGASNDPLEQEADRVADQVMARPTPSEVSNVPLRIQRYSDQTTGSPNIAPASVDHVLASSGRPLDPALRSDMERRFGYDFSGVRVHSGAAAEQSAWDMNANAYTVGSNIAFGAGRYAPDTHEGRRLIAHELTHVVQQSAAGKIHVDPINEDRGQFPISPHVVQRNSGSGKRVLRNEKTIGKATDPFEEYRKALLEIQKNWEEIKSVASSFKGTEEWITRGNTVVFLIEQHTTAAISASKAGRSQLFEFYLKLLESDKVMYDYIAWHVIVHVNILGMKSELSSLEDSFKADDREFTGRKEAEEYLQLLQKLVDTFPMQSDNELKQVNVSIKVKAKSSDVILAETTATAAYSDKSLFENETSKLIDLQRDIQYLAGELNKFLDNAQREGLQQAGEALIAFILERGGGKSKSSKKTQKKKEEKKKKKEEKKGEKGKWGCRDVRCNVYQDPKGQPPNDNCPPRVIGEVPYIFPSYDAACKAAQKAANLLVPRGCVKRHCNCKTKCTKK